MLTLWSENYAAIIGMHVCINILPNAISHICQESLNRSHFIFVKHTLCFRLIVQPTKALGSFILRLLMTLGRLGGAVS